MDTPQTLRDELIAIQREIMTVGSSMPEKAKDAAVARGEYERLKNNYIISLFAEEADENWKGKRTEAQRTAMYRSLYSHERLQASLAENEYKASSENLRGLQSALTALQTRARIAENEYKAGGYTT
jgi:hypothetical protein